MKDKIEVDWIKISKMHVAPPVALLPPRQPKQKAAPMVIPAELCAKWVNDGKPFINPVTRNWLPGGHKSRLYNRILKTCDPSAANAKAKAKAGQPNMPPPLVRRPTVPLPQPMPAPAAAAPPPAAKPSKKSAMQSMIRKPLPSSGPGAPARTHHYQLALQLAHRQLEAMRKPYSLSMFKTIRKLGSGAFGEALLVERRDNGERLVMKRLLKKTHGKKGKTKKQKGEDGPSHATSWDSLVTEVSVLRHLRNICAKQIVCYDGFFEDKDYYYVTTQYLGDMQPLEDVIKEHARSPLSPIILGRIIDNLVIGISLIHSQDIAHRDIKPANLLANSRTGEVRYIDFGLACWESQCNNSGIAGTKAYTPGDVWNVVGPTNLATFKSHDAWSLGLVIWELIVGEQLVERWWTRMNRIGHALNGKYIVDNIMDAFWKHFSYKNMDFNPVALDSAEVEYTLKQLPLSTSIRTLTGLLSNDPYTRLVQLEVARRQALELAQPQMPVARPPPPAPRAPAHHPPVAPAPAAVVQPDPRKPLGVRRQPKAPKAKHAAKPRKAKPKKQPAQHQEFVDYQRMLKEAESVKREAERLRAQMQLPPFQRLTR